MQGALVILLAMVIVGALLYITDVKYFRHHHGVDKGAQGGSNQLDGNNRENILEKEFNASAKNPTDEEICCGQHLVCEKTSLAVVSDEIVYYDDEELDRFRGRQPESYSPQETEEFRDILLTLLPEDVPGWAKSITLRRIELPPEVRDELLLLVADLRS